MIGTVGEPCLVREPPTFAIKNIGLFKSRGEVEGKWLYYYLSSPLAQEKIRQISAGTTQSYISLGALRNFVIAVPSDRNEMQEIASLFAAFDDKIELNRRMNGTLEAIARAIYEERCADCRNTIRLGELAEIYDGPHATPTRTTHGPVFLGISNLANGYIDYSGLSYLSEEDFIRWTRRVVPASGDIVFSYETRLGECARIPEGFRCCLGRRMGLLRPKQGRVYSELLLYAFLSADFQETIRCRTVHGSTVDRILLTEMHDFPVVMPSFEEQSKLVEVLSPIRQRAEYNRRENETIAALRNILLPKLMSGEIRLRDAEKLVEAAA
jgi:type I restriction enzyme, S subunit